jgi:DNA-binding LacI/PurR family transcriptional regulator
MPTLKDLALTLNLSPMAVSKALRDAPDISAATKARVQAEAKRRHYVPNRAAQNLRLQRTGLIGVIVPQINHTFYSRVVWGIERQAEPLGLQMVLGHSLNAPDQEMREARKMMARQVEVLLLVPAVRWQNRLATLEMLRSSRTPTVLLENYPAGAENFAQVSWVVSDDRHGGLLATNHLIELGHREILFLAGPNGSSASAGRFNGYQRGLADAGIAYSDARVFLAERDIDGGRSAMAKALSEKVPFTAIVAHNDSIAIGAIDILQQQGFKVPGDVSVVGFGDGLLAENFRVRLTTIRVPCEDIGETGLRLARELQAGEKAVESRELPVEIIVRGSTVARA